MLLKRIHRQPNIFHTLKWPTFDRDSLTNDLYEFGMITLGALILALNFFVFMEPSNIALVALPGSDF